MTRELLDKANSFISSLVLATVSYHSNRKQLEQHTETKDRRNQNRAGKVPQRVKMLAVEPDDLEPTW